MLTVSLICLCCKQKTAYDMRISDWSSDVCSSDLSVPTGWEQAPHQSRSTQSASERADRVLQGWHHPLPAGSAGQPVAQTRRTANGQATQSPCLPHAWRSRPARSLVTKANNPLDPWGWNAQGEPRFGEKTAHESTRTAAPPNSTRVNVT